MNRCTSIALISAISLAACGAASRPSNSSGIHPPEAMMLVPKGFRSAVLASTVSMRVREYDEAALPSELLDTSIEIIAHYQAQAPAEFIPLGDWIIDRLYFVLRDDLSADRPADSSATLAYLSGVDGEDGRLRYAVSDSSLDRMALEHDDAVTEAMNMSRRVDVGSPLDSLLQGHVEMAILTSEERASLVISRHKMSDRLLVIPIPGGRVLRLAARKSSRNGARIAGRLRAEIEKLTPAAFEPAP